jgi:hypothetical protein
MSGSYPEPHSRLAGTVLRKKGDEPNLALPRPIDFVSAGVIAEDHLYLATGAADRHLTGEAVALFDYRTPAVVAMNRRHVVRTVAVNRVTQNLLHTRLGLAYVEHPFFGIPEDPQRNNQHRRFEGDNREARQHKSSAWRPLALRGLRWRGWGWRWWSDMLPRRRVARGAASQGCAAGAHPPGLTGSLRWRAGHGSVVATVGVVMFYENR